MKKQPTVTQKYLTQRHSHLALRNKKIFASRFAIWIRWLVGFLIIAVVVALMFGVLGVIAYSLKNGGKIPGIESTPLRFLVKTTPVAQETRHVVGLPGIPAFPKSEFVFESYINQQADGTFTLKDTATTEEQDALYRFLTSGQSVYRLPVTATWEEVKAYYRETLPGLGWNFEATVAITDIEKIPGEYYTLNNEGLHIYEVSSDIWYEKVTKEQAVAGLRDKVVAYKAKQELVLAASGKDLTADTGWQLKYSRDWTLDAPNHPVFGKPNLYFTHDKSKERVMFLITKQYTGNIADVSYTYLEQVGTEFLMSWLSTQQTSIALAGFTKTQRTVGDAKALEFSDSRNNAYFLVIVNKGLRLTYVIQYNGTQNAEFFEYIKNNLKEVSR